MRADDIVTTSQVHCPAGVNARTKSGKALPHRLTGVEPGLCPEAGGWEIEAEQSYGKNNDTC